MNLFEVNNTPVLEALYDFNEKVDDMLSECYITKTILESCNDPDILFEADTSNKFKEAKEKVVKFFKELWKKISEWFNNLITKIKNFLNNNNKFVKNNEQKINKNIDNIKKIFHTNFKEYDVHNYLDDFYKLLHNVIDKLYTTKVRLQRRGGNTDESLQGIDASDIKREFIEQINKGGYDGATIENICYNIEKKHSNKYSNHYVTDDQIRKLKFIINNSESFIRELNKSKQSLQNTINDLVKDIENDLESEGYDERLLFYKRYYNVTISMYTDIINYGVQYVTKANSQAIEIFKPFM